MLFQRVSLLLMVAIAFCLFTTVERAQAQLFIDTFNDADFGSGPVGDVNLEWLPAPARAPFVAAGSMSVTSGAGLPSPPGDPTPGPLGKVRGDGTGGAPTGMELNFITETFIGAQSSDVFTLTWHWEGVGALASGPNMTLSIALFNQGTVGGYQVIYDVAADTISMADPVVGPLGSPVVSASTVGPDVGAAGINIEDKFDLTGFRIDPSTVNLELRRNDVPILSTTSGFPDDFEALRIEADGPGGEFACFDDIGVDLSSALPVDLSSFTATGATNGVVLHWRTESETNNIGFNIYRSTIKDGKFKRVGFVEGHGSTAVAHEYTFMDKRAKTAETYYYYLDDIDIEGKTEKSDLISITFQPGQSVPLKELPARFALYQNFPNPFNPETWLPYDLAADASVHLTIFNAVGRPVRHWALGHQSAGSYLTRDNAVYWDGRDASGELVGSGLYFYQLQADRFTAVKRMVVLK